MRCLALILMVLGFGQGAMAQTYPALHDVSGVGAGDMLNVRAGPGVGNPVIGRLAPDQTGVEVLGTEGNWALINIDERTGWTSLRFLNRRADGDLPNTQRAICSGTEPFWSLDIRQGQTAELRTPDTAIVDTYTVGLFQGAHMGAGKYVLRGVGGAREIAVVVTHAACTDGMSDRAYGLDATVIVTGRQGPSYSGCCSLTEF
ncbi:SH3 domain-containing protein [Sagittula sp. SSi028]|uniref:SH3 domain-containing protein n=1 Tax=Sagittula sp. SSi028 TaxID=3400636 RepID=UPI003AF57AD6